MNLKAILMGVLAVCVGIGVSPHLTAGKEGKLRGPDGIYFVQFPWEADFIDASVSPPEPGNDGIPEVYAEPNHWEFHPDGLVTSGAMTDSGSGVDYWKIVGDHTVAVRSMVFLHLFVADGPCGPGPLTGETAGMQYVVSLGEAILTFSEDWKTFQAEVWGKDWYCPLGPWGNDDWSQSCPNPLTTTEPPSRESSPGNCSAQILGWRMDRP